jgi:SH3-like domain-containing protein
MRKFLWDQRVLAFCVLYVVCFYVWDVRGEELREEGCSPTGMRGSEGRDYVYLLYDESSMRTGPNFNYSLCRIYNGRRGLPFLEWEKVSDWHLVQDWRGVLGWIHESQLKREVRPFGVVRTEGRLGNVYEKPRLGSLVIARLEEGYLVRVDSGECDEMWCYMEVLTKDGELGGWMRRLDLWGLP